MDNLDFNIEKYLASGTKSIKDYILLVRTHLKSLIFISLTILILTAAYAFIKKDLFPGCLVSVGLKSAAR